MSINIETAQVTLQLDLSRFNQQFELVRKKLLSLNKILIAPTLRAAPGDTKNTARDAALLSTAFGNAAVNADKVAKAIKSIDVSKFIDNRFKDNPFSKMRVDTQKLVSSWRNFKSSVAGVRIEFKKAQQFTRFYMKHIEKTFAGLDMSSMRTKWVFTWAKMKLISKTTLKSIGISLKALGGVAISTGTLIKTALTTAFVAAKVAVVTFTKLAMVAIKFTGKAILALGAKIKGALGPILKFIAPLLAIIGIIKGINSQRVDDRAFRSLSATLAKTGTQIGRTEQQVRKLIDELDGVTSVAKDQLANAFSILATFVNITGDTFDRTARAAVDMAQVMGTDVKAAALQLGKALNDPIRGVTALTRVGVSFTQQEREKIKALVEANKTLQAQKFILDAIEKQGIGGQAQAAADGWDQVKKAFADILKIAGTLFTDLFGITGQAGAFAERLRAVESTLKSVQQSDFFKSMRVAVQTVTRQFGVLGKYVGGPLVKAFVGLTLLSLRGIGMLTDGFFKFIELSLRGLLFLERKLKDVFGGKVNPDSYLQRFLRDLKKASDITDLIKGAERLGPIPVVLDADEIDMDIPLDEMQDFTSELRKTVNILSGADALWQEFQSSLSDSVGDAKNLRQNLNGIRGGTIDLEPRAVGGMNFTADINRLISVNRDGFAQVTGAVRGLRPAFIN